MKNLTGKIRLLIILAAFGMILTGCETTGSSSDSGFSKVTKFVVDKAAPLTNELSSQDDKAFDSLVREADFLKRKTGSKTATNVIKALRLSRDRMQSKKMIRVGYLLDLNDRNEDDAKEAIAAIFKFIAEEPLFKNYDTDAYAALVKFNNCKLDEKLDQLAKGNNPWAKKPSTWESMKASAKKGTDKVVKATDSARESFSKATAKSKKTPVVSVSLEWNTAMNDLIVLIGKKHAGIENGTEAKKLMNEHFWGLLLKRDIITEEMLTNIAKNNPEAFTKGVQKLSWYLKKGDARFKVGKKGVKNRQVEEIKAYNRAKVTGVIDAINYAALTGSWETPVNKEITKQ
ncbi:MAG: hypothetical protein GY793_05420 [Proteobacteria bacterium]|nr:hypothetical protein [Pseudomonadota bacterium]